MVKPFFIESVYEIFETDLQNYSEPVFFLTFLSFTYILSEVKIIP
jgi:hypothetical protein